MKIGSIKSRLEAVRALIRLAKRERQCEADSAVSAATCAAAGVYY